MNIFVASGHLGNDIEVRTTPNGKHIGQFNIPVKRGWGDNEKISWVKCVLLGERAVKLAPYLPKGTKVTVSGEFQLEEWEKEGVQHSKPCIVVNNIELPPKQESAPQQEPHQGQHYQQQPQAPQSPAMEDFDDDIPF